MGRNNLVQCSRCVMDLSAIDISLIVKDIAITAVSFKGFKRENIFDKIEIQNKLNKFLKVKNGRNKK